MVKCIIVLTKGDVMSDTMDEFVLEGAYTLLNAYMRSVNEQLAQSPNYTFRQYEGTIRLKRLEISDPDGENWYESEEAHERLRRLLEDFDY